MIKTFINNHPQLKGYLVTNIEEIAENIFQYIKDYKINLSEEGNNNKLEKAIHGVNLDPVYKFRLWVSSYRMNIENLTSNLNAAFESESQLISTQLIGIKTACPR